MVNEILAANEKQHMNDGQGNQYSSSSFPDLPSSLESNDFDDNERLARSRERNREHARRTRLRKKAQLQLLQTRVKELQAEGRVLKQSIEQCSIASILIGLSSGSAQDDAANVDSLKNIRNLSDDDLPVYGKANNKKRKRLPSDASDLTIKINGISTIIGGGGKTHINWKTGVYSDENGIQKQLSPNELETLRRERNRMHAKMTRDRKKCFISSVEKTIAQLEDDNRRMKEQLLRHSSTPGAVVAHPPVAHPPTFTLPPQVYAAAAQAAAVTNFNVDINAAAVTAAVIAAQQLELSVLHLSSSKNDLAAAAAAAMVAAMQPVMPQFLPQQPDNYLMHNIQRSMHKAGQMSSGGTLNGNQCQDPTKLFSVVA